MPKGPPPSTSYTPLAPSTEKAYYRKCIQLKRRLTEVEAANEEARVRRLRLDRAIMKMRLERAFLLEQLSKRMEHNVDGSEGSGEEGMATPPPDRPHRDKRRRPAAPGPGHPDAEAPPPVPGPNGKPVRANAYDSNGDWIYIPPAELAALEARPLPHGSPYGAPVGVPGAAPPHANGYEETRTVSGSADAEAAGPGIVSGGFATIN